MAKELITAPDVEPVTLDEAKRHLRISSDSDDLYVSALITAAREMVESFTERALISQSWEIYLDEFPTGNPTYEVEMPLPPLSAVASVKYYDSDDQLQTLSSDEYHVDTKRKPGRLVAVDDWPDTYDRPNAVTIAFTAGYGASGDTVPTPIKQAILLLIGEMYENREETIVGVSASQLPLTAERLLFPYRVFSA